MRRDASWRRMNIVQPAARELQVVRWTHAQGGDSETLTTLPFLGEFVTMGRVCDITESFLRDTIHMYASFGLAFE
jgi:hypothetical protein